MAEDYKIKAGKQVPLLYFKEVPAKSVDLVILSEGISYRLSWLITALSAVEIMGWDGAGQRCNDKGESEDQHEL